MVLLHGLSESEDQNEELRAAAKRVAAGLRKKAAR
jgi:hypothetical protein